MNSVPAAEGEVVEVIVIRGSHDAERYACAPVAPAKFSDEEDALGWDGEGWDEFAHEARWSTFRPPDKRRRRFRPSART